MFVNGRIIQENVVMLTVAENNTRRKKVRLLLSVIHFSFSRLRAGHLQTRECLASFKVEIGRIVEELKGLTNYCM